MITINELREIAKEAKVKNWKNLSKDELLNEIYSNRHYALVLDYMEDYGVSFEIAQDMTCE